MREIEGLSDRSLFEHLLKPGERTPVFDSGSRILTAYGMHRIGFFYLHVGAEIAALKSAMGGNNAGAARSGTRCGV